MENIIRENFSYSKLTTFQTCPFKYKLIYIDKNFVDTSNIATIFGTLIHYIEEQIGLKIKNNEQIDYSSFKHAVTALNEPNLKGSEIIKGIYKEQFYALDKNNMSYEDKLNNYLLFGIYRLEKLMLNHPSYKIIGLEIPFEFTYLDYKFKGFIDRLLYDSKTDTYIIQDIKTYSKEVDSKTLNNPLQFVIYALALIDKYGENINIKCQYDLPLIDKLQDCKMNIDKGVSTLTKLLNKIKQSDFKPNPTPLCHWCPFCKTFENQPDNAKNKCFYYSLWTKEHKTFAVEHKWQGIEHYQKLLEKYI